MPGLFSPPVASFITKKGMSLPDLYLKVKLKFILDLSCMNLNDFAVKPLLTWSCMLCSMADMSCWVYVELDNALLSESSALVNFHWTLREGVV